LKDKSNNKLRPKTASIDKVSNPLDNIHKKINNIDKLFGEVRKNYKSKSLIDEYSNNN